MEREPTVSTKTSGGMHIAVVWYVRSVGLLYPECHWLRNQLLELDIVSRRHDVYHKLEIAPNARVPYNLVWK